MKACLVCGKKSTAFFGRHKVSDGFVCHKCFKDIGINIVGVPIKNLPGENEFSSSGIARYRQNLSERSNAEQFAGFLMDDTTSMIYALQSPDKDYSYSELLAYEPIETPENVSKNHSISHGIAGAVIGGAAGAVVGAASGQNSYSAVSELSVMASFSDGKAYKAQFIYGSTKTNTPEYRKAKEQATALSLKLEGIINANKAKQSTAPSSDADEIRKLKQLADDGILTEDEFEAKKRQVLGI